MADDYTNPLDGIGGEITSTAGAIGDTARAYMEVIANAEPVAEDFDMETGNTFSESSRAAVAAQAGSIADKAKKIPIIPPIDWWNPIPPGYLN